MQGKDNWSDLEKSVNKQLYNSLTRNLQKYTICQSELNFHRSEERGIQ